MEKHISIVVLGYGPIARYVIDQISDEPRIRILALVSRKSSIRKAQQFANGQFPIVTTINEVSIKPDIVVDCSGHSGLTEHGPVALKTGINVISISTGALANPGFLDQLEINAKAGESTIKFLSGAVGGIDCLLAANIGGMDEVRYVGRKPPHGWTDSYAEQFCDLENLQQPFVHFAGTAREAARLYPANANVAATIALASIGLDYVTVELIADPGILRNIHQIEATGKFGTMKFHIEGNPLETNPKSSALAAMSIVQELRQQISSLRF